MRFVIMHTNGKYSIHSIWEEACETYSGQKSTWNFQIQPIQQLSADLDGFAAKLLLLLLCSLFSLLFYTLHTICAQFIDCVGLSRSHLCGRVIRTIVRKIEFMISKHSKYYICTMYTWSIHTCILLQLS